MTRECCQDQSGGPRGEAHDHADRQRRGVHLWQQRLWSENDKVNIFCNCGLCSGQLGREGSQTRLEEVPGLAQYSVTGAAAGANHCLVVDQWGSVFSWGSDESGQVSPLLIGLFWVT